MALIAGVLGIGLSWLATHALLTWGASQLPQGVPVGMDVRVLLFTVAISLMTGVIFGIFPALQLAGIDLHTTLREEGRSSSAGHARGRMNEPACCRASCALSAAVDWRRSIAAQL